MILYLNELNVKEFFSFENFIHSPYFSRNRNVKLLFDYIKPFYPGINEDNISYESVSKYVFKEKAINKVKIRKLLSDFSKVVETFLLQMEMENDTDNNKYLLLKTLRKRGLTRQFN